MLFCDFFPNTLLGQALDLVAIDPEHCLLNCNNDPWQWWPAPAEASGNFSGPEPKRNQPLLVSAVWGYPQWSCCHSNLWWSSSPADHLPLLSLILIILLDSKILRRCRRLFLLVPYVGDMAVLSCFPISSASAMRQARVALPGSNCCRKEQKEIWFYRAANILKALREKPQPQFPNQVGSEALRSRFIVSVLSQFKQFQSTSPIWWIACNSSLKKEKIALDWIWTLVIQGVSEFPIIVVKTN